MTSSDAALPAITPQIAAVAAVMDEIDQCRNPIPCALCRQRMQSILDIGAAAERAKITPDGDVVTDKAIEAGTKAFRKLALEVPCREDRDFAVAVLEAAVPWLAFTAGGLAGDVLRERGERIAELEAAVRGGRAEQDAMHADLGDLLRAVGMFDGARPESPHEVMLQAVDVARRDHARVAELDAELAKANKRIAELEHQAEAVSDRPATASLPAGECLVIRHGDKITIDQADPVILISAELLAGLADAVAPITIDPGDHNSGRIKEGGGVGVLVTMTGVNRTVSYRLTRWHPEVLAYAAVLVGSTATADPLTESAGSE